MKPFNWILVALGLVLLSAHVAPGAETCTIDSARSTVSFAVHHFVGLTSGTFTQCTGAITIDRQHPEKSSVSAVILVMSIDTGIRKRDEHLCSPAFFDASKYPKITFQSRRIIPTAARAGDIEGNLTMHGITKSIVLHVKLLAPMGEGEALARSRWAVTTEPLKRRDFNLMFGKTAEILSGIGPEVTVHLEIEATKADAT